MAGWLLHPTYVLHFRTFAPWTHLLVSNDWGLGLISSRLDANERGAKAGKGASGCRGCVRCAHIVGSVAYLMIVSQPYRTAILPTPSI